MTKDDIYYKIRSLKGRITDVRKKIVQIFLDSDCLMSGADILGNLNKVKLYPNRSTLFRELLYLTKNNIVIKNNISGIDYYEIPHEHHHHLVCLNCKAISKVEIGNHLEKQEKQIAKQNKFNIINHSLEFYGYCRECQD
jgi:Fur family transcriptional regulator, ferric uptake regulator